MQEGNSQFEARDFGLFVFIVVAGWFLLFWSGLFY